MSPLASATPTRLTSTSSNAGLGGGRGKPLSLRLYKILGTPYEDESTREALEILSGLYAPAVVEPPSSAGPAATAGKSTVVPSARRNPKVDVGGAQAEVEAESDESEDGTVVSAPRTGTFKPTTITHTAADGTRGNDSAARARKNLKRDVEMKMTRSSRLFLSAFREVDKVRLMSSRRLFWRTNGLFLIEFRCAPDARGEYACAV